MDTRTIQQIQQQVDELIEKLALEVKSTVEVGESQVVEINLAPTSEDENLGILIGRGGETLHALQLILALMINTPRENDNWLRIVVDVDGYREQREDSLRSLALRMAEKCQFLGEPVPLEPMHAADRRIVHMTLAGEANVATESTGEGRSRRVVIKPAA